MRILLLLLTIIALISCSKPDISLPNQSLKTASHDPKQYSILNEKMIYNDRFAEIFKLTPEEAVELTPGVLAIRIYWTVLANPNARLKQLKQDELVDNLPSLQVQLFLEENIPVQLNNQEGTLYNYEAFVRSGFRYFQHITPEINQEIEQANYQQFYNRIILSSNSGDGVVSSTLHRYKKAVVPGITAIEFDSLFRIPFDMYIYIGNQPASPEISVPQAKAISRAEKNYNPELFFRVTFPDELAPILKQPYRVK